MPSPRRRTLVAGCALAVVSLGSAWAADGVGAAEPAPVWQASLSNALAVTHDGASPLADSKVDQSAANAGVRSVSTRADRDLARNPLDESAAPAKSAAPSLEEQARQLVAKRKAAEAAEKAAAKAKAAAAAANAEAARLANLHRWVRPNYGPLSSPFGGRWGRIHEGIDLAGGYGSPILAATAGTVLYAGPESGYGEVLKIADWDGTQTWYGHMSKFVVKAGDHVKPGQEIALVGAAGDATGPHLHFEVRVNGTPIDPIPFLAARGIRI